MSEFTQILANVQRGEPEAATKLLPLIYDALRQVAGSKMAREKEGHTLQPTALVHEAWLRLTGDEPQDWDSRNHFFSAAAEAMRRILIENARRKHALKRGGGAVRLDLDLDEIENATQTRPEVLLLLDEALDKLGAVDPAAAKLIQLRFYVGMTIKEAADALDISERSAKRSWTFARAWLYRQMKQPHDPKNPAEGEAAEQL